MRKASAVLLTAVVVVLGLVAFAPKPPPEPTVVAGAVGFISGGPGKDVYRFWPDGRVEVMYYIGQLGPCFDDFPVARCGWEEVVEHPAP